TDTDSTPGTRAIAFSTLATHEAQVMPSMGSDRETAPAPGDTGPAPAFRAVAAASAVAVLVFISWPPDGCPDAGRSAHPPHGLRDSWSKLQASHHGKVKRNSTWITIRRKNPHQIGAPGTATVPPRTTAC